MQLQRLKIPNFRNLRDFEITFTGSTADADGTARTFKSHAVIGQNGSGKSNMIEALVTIFRDLDFCEPPSFAYELDYEIRGHQIRIVAKREEFELIEIDGKPGSPVDLTDSEVFDEKDELVRGSAREYLPSHVFTYYSGKNERIEELFQEPERTFVDSLDRYREGTEADALLRRLFYCRHPHSKLVLLACLLAVDSPLKEVLRDLRIEEIDSALFTLKRPFRLSREITEGDKEFGDKRFWYDSTRFSEEFLNELWNLAVAPIDFTEDRTVDFRGRTEPQDLLYLYLKDKEALASLRDSIGDDYRFFRYVEGSYISDLLDDVQIFVKHRHADDVISVEQLSEGELQLLRGGPQK